MRVCWGGGHNTTIREAEVRDGCGGVGESGRVVKDARVVLRVEGGGALYRRRRGDMDGGGRGRALK